MNFAGALISPPLWVANDNRILDNLSYEALKWQQKRPHCETSQY